MTIFSCDGMKREGKQAEKKERSRVKISLSVLNDREATDGFSDNRDSFIEVRKDDELTYTVTIQNETNEELENMFVHYELPKSVERTDYPYYEPIFIDSIPAQGEFIFTFDAILKRGDRKKILTSKVSLWQEHIELGVVEENIDSDVVILKVSR